MNKSLLKHAVINSVLTAIYIALVAVLMTNAGNFFGQATGVLGGLSILLLFTLSALIVGSLVLGKPLMLYLDGNKKDAVKLLIYTIVILAVITIITFGILTITSR